MVNIGKMKYTNHQRKKNKSHKSLYTAVTLICLNLNHYDNERNRNKTLKKFCLFKNKYYLCGVKVALFTLTATKDIKDPRWMTIEVKSNRILRGYFFNYDRNL